jgi:dnaB-like helicase N terminal domain|nr:MAG TPA: DnaB-like replicative helicase [Caudoviricetes sp.]
MYDEELERAMLYYVIFEQEQYALDETDFINERNKKIIKAINELRAEKKEISMLSIKSKIKANGSQVLEYISSLGDFVRTSSAENVYSELISLSKKRKIFDLLQSKVNEIADAENIDVLAENIIKQINSIERLNEKEQTFSEQVLNTVSALEENYNNKNDYSLYTGLMDLDNKICGLHNQELTIIGARPGVGKTTFALQIATKIAEKSKNVTIISLEMSDIQIIQKILATKTKVNSYKMRMGTIEDEDWEKIAKASTEIAKLPINLITKATTIQAIETIARKLKNRNKLDLLIIDYIQLIKNKGKFNNREQEVADITRTLKLLSLDLKIPIIGICQLNRNATRQEPSLADLRESGAIEQDADNVIFLYQEKEQEDSIVDITVKIAKQRAGEVGKVYMKFNKPNSEFKGVMRC